ncbi:MAG: hypothetical protein GF401_20200 [Chitinivibrionales bacterium]|nr:hypothetical protein [Chitinivibrionales bacterium]
MLFALPVTICISSVQGDEIVLDGSSSEKEYYEKLGLSLPEWQYIKRNRMPMKKVYKLMRAGISITEYSKEPWKEMRISERKWIRKRQAGFTDEEIMYGPSGESLGRWCVLQSFLFPGYTQIKQRQYLKGYTMLGAAGISLLLGGFTLGMELQSKETPVDYPVFFFVCLPLDMAWSGIDMYVQVEKSTNKDAARFSQQYPGGANRVSLLWNIPLRFRKS